MTPSRIIPVTPEPVELPHPVWSGSFMIGGLEMRCHVLSDGQRIIEAECIEALFAEPRQFDADELAAFARWTKGLDQ